jgi:cation:H+ antiporter
LAIFIGVSFYQARKNKSKETNVADLPKNEKGRNWWLLFLFVAIGTAGLIIGAQWFLSGAESVARNLGVSDRVIAITLVAFGTSVPELAASVVAAFKKEQDISLGNIVGSNLFNLFAILGITSIVSPVRVAPEILSNDIFWMLGTSFAILPLALFRSRLGRIDGLIFISTYLIFVYLLLIAP